MSNNESRLLRSTTRTQSIQWVAIFIAAEYPAIFAAAIELCVGHRPITPSRMCISYTSDSSVAVDALLDSFGKYRRIFSRCVFQRYLIIMSTKNSKIYFIFRFFIPHKTQAFALQSKMIVHFELHRNLQPFG